MISITLPTRIPLRVGGKPYPIQLNPYRNWNPYISNKLKQMYAENLEGVLATLPKLNPPIRLDYTLKVKDKRIRDLGNMCYIVDKFLSDSLVRCGLIQDDNYYFIDEINFKYEGLDKDIQDPYQVEVKIYDRNER